MTTTSHPSQPEFDSSIRKWEPLLVSVLPGPHPFPVDQTMHHVFIKIALCHSALAFHGPGK